MTPVATPVSTDDGTADADPMTNNGEKLLERQEQQRASWSTGPEILSNATSASEL